MRTPARLLFSDNPVLGRGSPAARANLLGQSRLLEQAVPRAGDLRRSRGDVRRALPGERGDHLGLAHRGDARRRPARFPARRARLGRRLCRRPRRAPGDGRLKPSDLTVLRDEAVGALRLERKLTTVAWKQLRDAAPERFPSVESLALAGDRLRGIAAQYARLRAGEISRLALLHRTGLGEAQLRLGTVAKTRGDLQ